MNFCNPNVLETIEAGFPQFVAIVFDFFWPFESHEGPCPKGLRYLFDVVCTLLVNAGKY